MPECYDIVKYLISVSRFQNGGISNDECMLNQVSVVQQTAMKAVSHD